ncbi:MAG TPA: alpha/beta hydrolase-fold protein [Amaricoccus sp.]|uniref:alpha/beta hydrolase n=1 Tax=Amaricoccus sp. TaxID=1872485 RepID=UPI002D10F12A|nr:alpha/beta hydrolase-fold protein [Amaricoccus sp.]HMQ92287.1 alpha/beta hydrolase-fold protein [Amaricoccus sp.]HMR51046.1 alpha/beta hydrolase-fold protein [Amaricoccus sp.]HMR60753.1 alpha/beta hydrolase-fold protein [Amaricoccus sp.]HMT97775.1 alpha/beta hydrolase-fold protein [Amaricoccus sp.]
MRGGVLLAAALVAAMPAAADPVVVPNSESFVMTAAETGRRYRILLARPLLPAPEAGYPVLYFLDGNATFQTAAEAMRLQTRPPKGFEPAAVVAIGYETDEPFDTARRYFDYTTPADPSALPKRGNGAPFPELGGADAFLDFIADELMPEIGRRLPTDPARATLFGHSLGGYFTLHAFLTRPTLFATWVAGSPSVWWNGEEILARAEAFDPAAADLEGRSLFIGVGAEELPDMVVGAGRMAEILAPLSERGLSVSHQAFAGSEHITVLPSLISRSFSLALQAPADIR